MPSNELLSSTEQKLLAGIAFLICFLYFANLADKIIGQYNETVRQTQIEKRETANGAEQISFGIYCGTGSALYEVIIGLQIFLAPLLFGCLSSRKTGHFLFSILLTSLALLGYLG